MKRMKNKNIIAAVIVFCLCACAMPVNILAANEKIEESTEKVTIVLEKSVVI